MKRIISLILLVPLLLLSSGCGKYNDIPPVDDCPCKESNLKTVPDSFKNWFWFSDDSWWVYQLKEDPSQLDTIRVVNKWKQIDYLPCYYITDVQALPCSQVLLVNVQHSNAKYFPFNKDTTRGAFDKINSYYGGEDLLKIHYINYEGARNTGVIFSEPNTINQKYTWLCLKDTIDVYEINNMKFKDVFYTESCDVSVSYPNSISGITWAKNVGLLRLEIVNSDTVLNTWELIDYNVAIEN